MPSSSEKGFSPQSDCAAMTRQMRRMVRLHELNKAFSAEGRNDE
jgi:hypothetical protein